MNKNPYFITEPAGISFSGGRTSAYMLYRILQAHSGKLPDFVRVTFANTGKEMPQTLDFVQRCSEEWGVDIAWLELGSYDYKGSYKKGRHKGKPIYKASTKIVDYETASRNGEPFERLIKQRGYLPGAVQRFCTAELKVRRIHGYIKKELKHDNHMQYIGIRADEKRRAIKIHGSLDSGHESFCPLYVDGITKHDISDFWNSQNFDLELPNNNGVTDWGNCDLCFLKGYSKKMSIIRERPELADWWMAMESSIENKNHSFRVFRNDQPNYQRMKIIATDQGNLFDLPDDETIPCFCGD